MTSLTDVERAAMRAYPQLADDIRAAADLVAAGRVWRRDTMTGPVTVVDGTSVKVGRCECGQALATSRRTGRPICRHTIAAALAKQTGRVEERPPLQTPSSPQRLETNLVGEQAALSYSEQRAWQTYQRSISGRRDLMVATHAHGNRIDPARYIRPDDDDETRRRVAEIAKTLNDELDRQQAVAQEMRQEVMSE